MEPLPRPRAQEGMCRAFSTGLRNVCGRRLAMPRSRGSHPSTHLAETEEDPTCPDCQPLVELHGFFECRESEAVDCGGLRSQLPGGDFALPRRRLRVLDDR